MTVSKRSFAKLANNAQSSFEKWASGVAKKYDLPEITASERREILSGIRKATAAKNGNDKSHSPLDKSSATAHPVDKHFANIFSGLETIQRTRESHLLSLSPADRVKKISQASDASAIWKMFDTLYYAGQLVPSDAEAVLNNHSFRQWSRLYDRVVTDDYKLVKWSLERRLMFGLAVIRKYFASGDKATAARFLERGYESVWGPALRTHTTERSVLQPLVNALLSLHPALLESDLPHIRLREPVAVAMWSFYCRKGNVEAGAEIIEKSSPKDTLTLRYLNTLLNDNGLDDKTPLYTFIASSPGVQKALIARSAPKLVDIATDLSMHSDFAELANRLLEVVSVELKTRNPSSISAALALSKIDRFKHLAFDQPEHHFESQYVLIRK